MNRRIKIHTKTLFHTDKLGEDFELPETPAVCEALTTISEACQREVNSRERQELLEFLGNKYAELKQLQESRHNGIDKVLLSIVNYKRKVPFEL